MYVLATLILVSTLFLSGCTSSSISGSKIKDITTDSGKYEGTEVTVSGKVIETNEPSPVYKINDGSASIYVNGDKAPKLNEQITVTGIVKVSPNNEVFIDATSKK